MAEKKKPTNRAPKKRTKPDWAPKLLEHLRKAGNISLACQKAGVGRMTFYERRDADAEFAKLAADALLEACDLLAAEARRRAVDGVVRKKFDKSGEPIIDPATGEQYVEREYSDTLLIFLLKAGNPAVYRENVRHEHTGPEGGPIPAKVTHDVGTELQPYADAFRLFVQSSLLRGGGGPVPPDGTGQPLDPPQAQPEAGAVPPP